MITGDFHPIDRVLFRVKFPHENFNLEGRINFTLTTRTGLTKSCILFQKK